EEKWETTEELEKNPTSENLNVTEEENNLHESKVKEQEKIEERKKTLPQTGGHVSYLPYIGGMLLVFALLILVINKRKWN
ncbi:LPXTG cell wall anchor domain-containing protein, partial [Bacillus sp. UNC437CL72CviS29]|uniref:LPXTG cell wall anchor domain-containing protein n=1 Tax=Bacillus sp. UNC437CL72CviS29 TaxID=1340430 RepID=UPI00054D73D7